MYIQEKKLIIEAEGELKKRMPFLSGWKISSGKKSTADGVDILADAKFKGQTYRFCIEAKSAGYPSYIRNGAMQLKRFIGRDSSYCPVLVVPFISEQGKKICDEYNINYVDLNGNAKIACGTIFIHTQGKSSQRGEGLLNQSIFSPKAARVTKLFLSYPHSALTQKDIVVKTALSKGLISRIIAKMIEAGYITRKEKSLALAGFDDLLSAWVDSELRRREKKRNYYVWAQNPRKLMAAIADKFSNNKVKYAFTQEAGASLVAPFATFDIVSVYVDSLDKFPEETLKAQRVDKGFNLTVIQAPDEFVFRNAQDLDDLKIVDNLQLYADLKKNPLRGEKQAEQILNRIKKALK